MKTAVVLTVAIVANSVGNLCLSKGMKQFEQGQDLGVAWLHNTASHVISNGWMIIGVLLLIVFLGAYLTALSWEDLSFVLPATAPAYLLNAALSKVFLHEDISLTRWAGTILIVTGTWLVARTCSGSSASAGMNAGPQCTAVGGPVVESISADAGSES
ncbi:MAG: hypothetical protein HYX72_07855 [Acidobacteria bacterium]|nr:hypothetical protein [Acidobacteriota bacterium]